MAYNALADNKNLTRSLKLHKAIMEQSEREAIRARATNALREAQEIATTPLATRLGVWVNGLLKFQSRDHAEIYGYAREKMSQFGNNVWVAPIGSFVDDKTGRKADARKIERVHTA